MTFRGCAIAALAFTAFAAHAQVPPFIVTSTADPSGPAGTVTLRDAINAANSSCISVATNPTITFALAGTGPFTIQPTSPLPAIACPATIDGYTQAGASGNTDAGGGNNASIQVILNGSGCAGCDGLQISASGVTIKGLSIHSFAGAGVRVLSGYGQMYGNYIGTDPGGMNPFPNAVGILGVGGTVYAGSGLDADRNLITGNSGPGIRTTASGINAIIRDNQIGGRRDGTSGMGNGGAGVELNDPFRHPFSNNFIRYNGGAGILVNSGTVTAIDTSNFGNGDVGINYVAPAPFPAPKVTSYLYDSLSNTTSVTVQVTGGPASSSFNNLDFYSNNPLPPFGEGQTHVLTAANVALDASGNALNTFTLSGKVDNPTVVFSDCGDGCFDTSAFSTPDFPPQLDIIFPTNPIALGSTGSIVLQLSNPNKTRTVGSVGYTFTLPSGLAMGTVTAGSDCAGSFVLSNTATSVTVSGVTLTPNPSSNMSCTLGATLTPTAGGTYNFVAGSTVIASDAGQGTNAAASLTVTTVAGITAAPNPLNFGTVQVGTSSSLVVSVQSNGTAPLDVTGATVTGAGYAVTGNTCTTGMVAPASCAITIKFAPTVFGAANGQLSITSSAATSPTNVLLTGTGGAPGLQFTPSSLTFASQSVFTTSASQTVVLSNQGSLSLNISSIVASGDFGYTGCGTPLSLAPGASCTMSVTFTPQANGTSTGSIIVTSNAATSPNVLPLTGTGVNGPTPGISVPTIPIQFGTVRVGTPATARITVTSNGTAPLSISSIQISTVPLPGFGFTQTNNCPASLPVAATCDINLTYIATVAGTHSGTLTIQSNAAPGAVSIPLSGTSVAQLPAALAVAGSLDFGKQVIGTTAKLPLDLRNTGEQSLNVASLAIAGAGFGLEGACGSIAAGATCTLTVVFTPTAVQPYTGTLRIVSNDPRGTVQVALSGEGLVVPRPEISVAPDGVGFANQMITTQSASQAITVKNVGSAALNIRGIATSGPFTLVGNSCPAALAPGSQCDVAVAFLPVTVGGATGRLTVDSDAEAGRGFASLSGNGCGFFSVAGMRNLVRLCTP